MPVDPPLTPKKPPFTPPQAITQVTPLKPPSLDAGAAPQAAVRKRLGPPNNDDMLVCQLADFLSHYGPSASATGPDPDVDNCFAKVVSVGLAGDREGGGYRWTAYRTKPKTKRGKPHTSEQKELAEVEEVEVEEADEKEEDEQEEVEQEEGVEEEGVEEVGVEEVGVEEVEVEEVGVEEVDDEEEQVKETVDCNPSGLGRREPETFNPLKRIVDCVLNFSKKGGKNKTGMHFRLVPNTPLTGDIDGSNHKIDGCFIAEPLPTKSEKFVANRNINVPMEFKKKRNSKDRAIVHLQILGACQHIMNEDVRRMWIYGLTLEDNFCSLWYFSRSHSVKTKAFDWIEDPKTFVRVLLAFAKATPSELGIDPTVHLILEGEKERASFVYEVPPSVKNVPTRYYKTKEVIFDPRPMTIAGRTTRVWKVIEVTDASGKQPVQPSKEMVLKDVWLNANNQTEAQNMDAIFAAVDQYVENGLKEQKLQDPDGDDEQLLKQFVQADPRFKSFDTDSLNRLCFNLTDKAYRRLFLDKVHDWQGQTCKELGPNLWPCNDLFSSASLDELKTQIAGSVHRLSTVGNGTRRDLEEEEREKDDVTDIPRLFAPKRQSRFIYRELCTTLEDLGTLEEVVDVLCQTMDAMHILFLAGWVHRDISSNNIMAYRSSEHERWSVKLADLEFSRMMVDNQRKANVDPRTGTPYFMAVEILQRAYLLDIFHNPPSLLDEPDDDSLAGDLDASITPQDYLVNLQPFKRFLFRIKNSDILPEPRWADVPKQSACVNHNYQHDLESIWWILLWVITSRIGHKQSAVVMKKYFSHRIEDSGGRRRVLLDYFLGEKEAGILPDVRPLWPILGQLRKSMQKAYLMRAVCGNLEVPEAYSSIQVEFSIKLSAIKRLAGPWRSIRLQSDSRAAQRATIGKRERELTAEDPSAEHQSQPKRIRMK